MLDESIRFPGGLRVGVEGIIGLIPGVGDLTGATISYYIVYEAAKLGVPFLILLKMIVNVVLETIIGVVPIAGDIFDLFYKANARNIALLEQAKIDKPKQLKPRSDKHILLSFLAVIVILLGLSVWFLIAAVSYMISLFT